MLLLHHLEELDEPCRGGVCMTIGVFDAVHRGHQMLIRRARDQARMRALKSLVFTFERHPLSLIAPAYCPPTLTQPDQKAELIGSIEVDICLLLKFTPEIAKITAEEFVRDVLVGRCSVKYIACGGSFSFGAGGKGNPQLLKQLSPRFRYDVEIVDPLCEGGAPISSTRVRTYLLEGRVAEATRMLNRRYRFSACVVGGHQRGRTIGFPTANLIPPAGQLIPADGVYAVFVQVGDRRHGAMLNIGNRPTFEGAGRAIEAHLFDFSGDLIGQTVTVEFVDRIREERKFESVDELIAQLRGDEQTCRRILASADS